MALGLTQPRTEMSTSSSKALFLRSRARQVRKSINLTVIRELIV
jgi:hypothetical protein